MTEKNTKINYELISSSSKTEKSFAQGFITKNKINISINTQLPVYLIEFIENIDVNQIECLIKKEEPKLNWFFETNLRNKSVTFAWSTFLIDSRDKKTFNWPKKPNFSPIKMEDILNELRTYLFKELVYKNTYPLNPNEIYYILYLELEISKYNDKEEKINNL
jgi:hypothetical protein